MKGKKNLMIFIAILVVVALVFAFVIQTPQETETGENIGNENQEGTHDQSSGEVPKTEDPPKTENPEPTSNGWRDVEIKDVKTGEFFKISDFSNQVVVLESFAVWCPTCKKQQDEVKELIEEGDTSIHISINTDPNEDESQVLSHLERHSYDWYFAVFPAEATQSLVDEFGIQVVNAPSAPMVLICPQGQGRLLDRGVKSTTELKEEIDSC